MPAMTTAHPRANWSRTPSLTELWLEALLRAFAMLWSNLADIVRMRPSRPLSDWHTEAAPASLPQQDRDKIEEHAPGPPSSPTTTTTTTTTTTSGCRTAAANASSRETTEDLLPRSEAHPPNEGRVLQPEDWLAAAGNYTPDRQRDCHPRKREAHSQTRMAGIHFPASGLADPWIPALQRSRACRGDDRLGCCEISLPRLARA